MSEDVPFAVAKARIGPSHYYGDIVRILFVINAVLIFIAQFLGNAFLTPQLALLSAVALVIAAGLTNPVTTSIHWVNTILSGGGLIIAGNFVLTRFSEGELLTKGWVVSAVTLIFVIALYSSIKTLRGALMRGAPIIK